MLPPLKPIAMNERVSMVFIEKGRIDVKDGAFVVIDETGIPAARKFDQNHQGQQQRHRREKGKTFTKTVRVPLLHEE